MQACFFENFINYIPFHIYIGDNYEATKTKLHLETLINKSKESGRIFEHIFDALICLSQRLHIYHDNINTHINEKKERKIKLTNKTIREQKFHSFFHMVYN